MITAVEARALNGIAAPRCLLGKLSDAIKERTARGRTSMTWHPYWITDEEAEMLRTLGYTVEKLPRGYLGYHWKISW